MKFRAWISRIGTVVVAGSLCHGVTSPLAAQETVSSPLEPIQREVAAIYERSKDAVVRVHAVLRPPPGVITLTPPRRVGTGFFLNRDGTLLTAASIVTDAESCEVELNGQRLAARLLGCDPRCNLAVLKLATVPHAVPVLPLGNSEDLRVGSLVVAIGFPFDLPSAPAIGLVGGFDIRQGPRIFPTSHIRASCRLNPGQAGSPLLNAAGEVVGVAVAAHAEDLCYALPINAARKVWTDLVNVGAARHGWVGLEVTEKTLPEPHLLVAQVFSNTPAAAAGFAPGDRLVRIEAKSVQHLADLMNAMFYRHAGERVAFTVQRNNTAHDVTVVVGEPPGALPPRPVAAPLSLVPVSAE